MITRQMIEDAVYRFVKFSFDMGGHLTHIKVAEYLGVAELTGDEKQAVDEIMAHIGRSIESSGK